MARVDGSGSLRPAPAEVAIRAFVDDILARAMSLFCRQTKFVPFEDSEARSATTGSRTMTSLLYAPSRCWSWPSLRWARSRRPLAGEVFCHTLVGSKPDEAGCASTRPGDGQLPRPAGLSVLGGEAAPVLAGEGRKGVRERGRSPRS